jgi:hypothetical protein
VRALALVWRGAERASDMKIDSDEEIWNTIRYLDPDGELRRSDIVAVVILILLFVSMGVIIFLFNH